MYLFFVGFYIFHVLIAGHERKILSRREMQLGVLLSSSYLVDVVLLAECVKDNVDLIEHVHHLHWCDVDADLIKFDHIAKQDGHIWEDLGYKQTHSKLE